MKSHYEVLGVPSSASDAEIKAAYREKAKEFHPDKNKGSDTAAAMFIKVSEAYEVLKDKSKRTKYDATLINSSGPSWANSRSHWYENNAPFNRRSSQDRTHLNIEVGLVYTMEDIAFGVTPHIPDRDAGDIKYFRNVVCPSCNGGEVELCVVCNGKKTIQVEAIQTPLIPRGATNRERLVVKGKGHQDPETKEFGDLIMNIREQKHDRFRHSSRSDGSQQLNIETDLEITLIDLIQRSITIRTLYEKELKVSLSLADIENMYTVVPEHGLPAWESTRIGKLFVNIKLRLPDPEVLTTREKVLLDLLSKAKNFKKA